MIVRMMLNEDSALNAEEKDRVKAGIAAEAEHVKAVAE